MFSLRYLRSQWVALTERYPEHLMSEDQAKQAQQTLPRSRNSQSQKGGAQKTGPRVSVQTNQRSELYEDESKDFLAPDAAKKRKLRMQAVTALPGPKFCQQYQRQWISAVRKTFRTIPVLEGVGELSHYYQSQESLEKFWMSVLDVQNHNALMKGLGGGVSVPQLQVGTVLFCVSLMYGTRGTRFWGWARIFEMSTCSTEVCPVWLLPAAIMGYNFWGGNSLLDVSPSKIFDLQQLENDKGRADTFSVVAKLLDSLHL